VLSEVRAQTQPSAVPFAIRRHLNRETRYLTVIRAWYNCSEVALGIDGEEPPLVNQRLSIEVNQWQP